MELPVRPASSNIIGINNNISNVANDPLSHGSMIYK